VQVLIAVALGVAIGWAAPEFGRSLKPLGDGFIKLVKMIITPVIFLTVVTGIAGMADLKTFGRVGAKAIAYFLAVSTLALGIGLIVANVVRPGRGFNADPATLDQSAVASYVQSAHEQGVTQFLLNIIPDTALSAFTSGEILQVLLVAILFGVSLTLVGEKGDRLLDILRIATAVGFRMVHILMYVAPIGAFGELAFTIGQYGIGSLANLAALIRPFAGAVGSRDDASTSLLVVIAVLGVFPHYGNEYYKMRSSASMHFQRRNEMCGGGAGCGQKAAARSGGLV
jgi:aerobic C4-dicarboxylate transport protein